MNILEKPYKTITVEEFMKFENGFNEDGNFVSIIHNDYIIVETEGEAIISVIRKEPVDCSKIIDEYYGKVNDGLIEAHMGNEMELKEWLDARKDVDLLVDLYF